MKKNKELKYYRKKYKDEARRKAKRKEEKAYFDGIGLRTYKNGKVKRPKKGDFYLYGNYDLIVVRKAEKSITVKYRVVIPS